MFLTPLLRPTQFFVKNLSFVTSNYKPKYAIVHRRVCPLFRNAMGERGQMIHVHVYICTLCVDVFIYVLNAIL